MHLFILGILVAQFTYITIQWMQLRYQEYLFYGTYIGTFILYVLILYRFQFLGLEEDSPVYEMIDSFKRPIAYLLYFEYFVFAQKFIDIKNRFPSVYKRIQPLKIIILCFIAVQVVLQLTGTQYSDFGNSLYYLFSVFLFAVFLTFFIRLWNTNDRLVRFLLYASLSISVGAFISNVLIILNMTGLIPGEGIYEYYFIPSLAGVFLEIYFFNTGIAYKISSAEKQLIGKQHELIQQLSVNEKLLVQEQKIRNKLAQDLHDDIGATLSGIALHSHMIKQLILENRNESVIRSLTMIENGAVEMVNNLNDVVWTVNPKNDSVEEMLEHLKEYTFNITQARNIAVGWKVDATRMKDLKLSMDLRRNVYLICKEAVNNAVKYSCCSELQIHQQLLEKEMIFTVRDNGNGFDINDLGRGNGLKNMHARAQESNMLLTIESAERNGTMISLRFQFTQ